MNTGPKQVLILGGGFAGVISGSIGLTNVVSPIRRLCPRTNLIMREVEDIDLKRQLEGTA